MAQKITVTLEDDLDGGTADQTGRFGLDGAEYEIDLSARNAAAFREQLEVCLVSRVDVQSGLESTAAETRNVRELPELVRT